MKNELYGENRGNMAEESEGIPARITAVHRGFYEIEGESGRGLARLAGKYRAEGTKRPAVGDFVWLDKGDGREGRIREMIPRRTCLKRRDPSSSGQREQVIAANFDYVFIVQSMDRDFNPRRLERYVTIAWESGGIPVVVLTKADQTTEPEQYIFAAEKSAAGIEVLAVSARTGDGMERLFDYLKPGKTAVLIGSSGVGKSTLANVLSGKEQMEVQSVRRDGRGRHTTTRRQLIPLECGAAIIDTPGMRELGMWDARDGLKQSFSDVEQYLGQCRFRDCRHQGEPGCAIADAIRRGALTAERFAAFQKLQEEMRFEGGKEEYLREKKQKFKQIARTRRIKGPDYRYDPCMESFFCAVCGAPAGPDQTGSSHRNHCPSCLASLHVDNDPGDRASLCRGIMDAKAIWVRKNGEWAIIHQCRDCKTLHANRIAADDDAGLLWKLAMKPVLLRPAGPRQGIRTGAKVSHSSVCRVCGRALPFEDGRSGHCPECLTGICPGERAKGGFSCGGRMEPIAVSVLEETESGDAEWEIIYRCRECGLLRSEPAAEEDNRDLLLSIAMRPAALPPFPLWSPKGG